MYWPTFQTLLIIVHEIHYKKSSRVYIPQARSVLLSYLPTSAEAGIVKPPSTTPHIRNGLVPTPNALRTTSPFRPQVSQLRPASASENGESPVASNADTGNRPEAAHQENVRNGHVTTGVAGGSGGGGGVSGVELTMRKLASSRMHIELERDRQRERDVRDEKMGVYRRTPTPIGGAAFGRGGGGGSKTPNETAKVESATKSVAGFTNGGFTNQSSQQRTKTKQVFDFCENVCSSVYRFAVNIFLSNFRVIRLDNALYIMRP